MEKTEKIDDLRNRYVIGLEKLEYAAGQIHLMQSELSILQPELMTTSTNTERLMIKIEQDTIRIETTKEVSESARLLSIS